MKKSLLIAEDEEVTLALLRNVFGRSDLLVYEARTGEEALQHIDQHPVDVVLTDLKMPGTDGLSVLAHARKVRPGVEVILMTGHASIESAVRAMKLGAFHYITKPFDIDEVAQLVSRALELTSVRRENASLRSLARGRGRLENFIGVSDATKEVLSLVRKVADTDSTVLITGESGTGKELIARALHYLSPRSDRMLVPINCSAIPAELLESELFGHVKGAFTGAHATRAGKFETAHNGTIFLDEIAEMSPPLQAKLLRVLQEKSVTPVGGNRAIQVDARVITATNKDLDEEVSEGRFRSDLYFRLNVIPIRIPPLRDRRDDIPLLVEHFIAKYNRERGRALEGVRPESVDILRRYTWPGNVRELENLVERIVVLKGSGWLEPSDIPEKIRRAERFLGDAIPVLGETGLDIKSATEDFENALIRQALHLTAGNKNRAATLLGLKRTTFVEMLKRKSLDVGEAPGPVS
ncbi:sigma-54 dependent transcriptional regulator [Candidatus Deferrimicrobium sp.]|uniref:sigma-54-dependent transcriptional regulator n=1 Tax=Candidatus Deferrimicrobium sp. TaxID=3060586 RepID=UPI002ECFF7BF